MSRTTCLPASAQQIHLCAPESQPDATGFSGAEPDAIKADPAVSAKDFVAEHSSIAGPLCAGRSSDRLPFARWQPVRIEKRASVKPHSVFLRKGCILPERLDPLCGAGLRKLDACGRDHSADSRYHDSPHGLALPVRAPPHFPKRLWAHGGRCGPASVGGCPEASGEAIQRRRACFRSGQEISGLSHRARHIATPPDPAIHFARDCRRVASHGRSLEISRASQMLERRALSPVPRSADMSSCSVSKRRANPD